MLRSRSKDKWHSNWRLHNFDRSKRVAVFSKRGYDDFSIPFAECAKRVKIKRSSEDIRPTRLFEVIKLLSD